MLNIISVEARDLPDAWFQCVHSIINLAKAHKYTIDRGSFEGQKRLEFDYITVHIKHPGTRSLLPDIPPGLGIPNPVADGYLEEYLPYLMTSVKQPGELYTYGERLEYQIQRVIDMFKKDGHNTNQACMSISKPSDIDLSDPPCLRSLDCRIKDKKLHFMAYFRSWDLWCIDDKSEILTKNGWRNIDTISVYDEVATLNYEKWRTEYLPIIGINTQPYKGEMFRIETKRIDQLITPNHKVLHKYVTHSGSKRVVKDWQHTQVKDLVTKDGSFIPLSAPYNGGSFSIGIDKASLLGWILTDAYYRKGCDTIEIYQSKAKMKYVLELVELLNRLGIDYTERWATRKPEFIVGRKTKEGYESTLHTFTIPARYARLWIKKLIPDRLPTHELLSLVKEERHAIFNSMIKADGCFKKGRNDTTSWVLYSQKAKTREWFQLLALSLGYDSIDDPKKGSVGVSNKNISMIQPIHFDGNRLPTEEYDGKVWCVSTKNNNFIMRRNNKISVTGNSGMPANLGAIQMLKEYMAEEIGVDDGEIIAASKGLHLYDYIWELAELRTGKVKG